MKSSESRTQNVTLTPISQLQSTLSAHRSQTPLPKIETTSIWSRWIGAGVCGLCLLLESRGLAQGTAFTYSGRLNDGANPANGNYDLTFSLFANGSGAPQVGSTLTNSAVGVSNGLFTVTLDFGENFPGASRWLELAVRTNGSGGFTTLSPRQQVLPTPYAIYSAGAATAATAGDAGNATNFTGQLSGDVTGIQSATTVANVGGETAASVASGVAAANLAASANSPNTIVKRDGSGNFSAGAVTVGSVSGNGSGLTSLNASQFTSGTMPDARLSANVALLDATQTFSGSNTVNGVLNATNSNNNLAGSFAGSGANLININAGNLTGTVSDARLSANVTLLGQTIESGEITDGTIVNADINAAAAIADTKLATIGTAGKVANSATTASSGNTANSIVARDASGNFAAGTIVAALSGNATTATTAVNFSGPLAGDVTGNQGATIVANVGGQTAANIASGASAANAATSANTANSLVKRDASGSFAAGTVTGNLIGNVTGNVSGSAASFTGSLGGDVNGTQGATVVSSVGGQSAASVASGANAANAATSVNTPDTIVKRDGSGNFSAAGITAGSVSGNGSGLTNLNGANLVNASVSAAKLASGAALSNLNASGQSGVPTGGLILSENAVDTNLLFAGYTPLSGSVSTLELWRNRGAGPLAARAYMASVWTGTELIIFGGNTATGGFGDGAKFNPALNIWSSIATNLGVGGGAVWTGTEMLVWNGGINPQRYNPASNTWITINTNGQPIPRSTLTTIWTGTEMIVWGGGTSAEADFPITGARYNPLTDTWTPMATNGAPAGRTYHVSVWTGTEMIVWGGRSGPGYPGTIYGDGARYSPTTDTWTPIASSGAPSARYGAAGVWSGSELIVWGGYGSTYLNTGGRYNPANNSWSATTTAGAPVPLFASLAVWTGREAIFWGGDPGINGTFINVGGRYDPAADSWRETIVSGAAPGRVAVGASAFAWIGDAMLVFGGYAANSGTLVPNELYSYTPPRTLHLYLKP